MVSLGFPFGFLFPFNFLGSGPNLDSVKACFCGRLCGDFALAQSIFSRVLYGFLLSVPSSRAQLDRHASNAAFPGLINAHNHCVYGNDWTIAGRDKILSKSLVS